MSTIEKKYFPALDIVKFIMALMIMFAHISSENVTINPLLKMLFSSYSFGVPFFFACSGYLFFLNFKDLDNKQRLKKYINTSKRIGLMYLAWSCIYFCFVLANWIINGADLSIILNYFHRALVFTTYSTIWFLPALWVGISVTFYFVYKNVSLKKIAIVGAILYLIGSVGFSYTRLIEGTIIENIYSLYNSVFWTTRNGLFFGFPMVFIGSFIALANCKKNRQSFNFVAMIIFSLLFIGESFFIRNNKMGCNDLGIMLLPTIYFMVKWLINVVIKARKSYVWMREMSMLVFLGQRLFITAIPSILPAMIVANIAKNGYIGLAIYASSVLIFSALIVKLSKKIKWLKILW